MKTAHNQIMILKFVNFLLKRTPAKLHQLKTASDFTKVLASCHVPFPKAPFSSLLITKIFFFSFA